MAVLAAIVAIVAVTAAAATVISASREVGSVTVVIDAGHGGADGGMVGGTTGTKESDINLSIAKYLAGYFTAGGYNVVLTRDDGGAVGGGIKYSKRDDMSARKKIIQDASPDLVISVHCNSYPVSSVRGAQAFFASPDGEKYAGVVQSYFNDVLNTKPRAAAVGDYYILKCSEYPSVLCECGFLSNPAEENLLITASYQEKVAYTVYSAIDAALSDQS